MKNLYTIMGVFAIALLAGTFFTFSPSAKATYNEACLSLTHNLFIGIDDAYAGNGEVTALQSYLYNHGYMLHVPTGYFGGLTWQGVVNFQHSNGIITTGYAGPLTRNQLYALTCGDPTAPPQTNISIESVSPSSGGPVGTTVTLSGTGFTSDNIIHFGNGAIAHVAANPGGVSLPCMYGPGCGVVHQTITFTVPSSIGPYCAPGMMCAMYLQLVTPGVYPISIENSNGTSNSVSFTVTGANSNSLSISGLDAPSSLTIGTPGTWTVHAASTGSNMHYSVLWGDEPVMAYGNTIAASPVTTVQSSATFTHSYARTGMYNPTFTVSDDFGHTTSASATVTVYPIY